MNVYQRLAEAMKEVTYVLKEQKRGMQYSIVSHDAVTAKVRPALLKHGIVYHPVAMEIKQDGNRTEMQISVRFVNIDEPADYFDVPSAGYGIDAQDKGPGKAISYAVKYALLKALGLETGDDPDMDQDVRHEPAPKASTTIRTTPAPQAILTGAPEDRPSNKTVSPPSERELRLLTKAEADYREIVKVAIDAATSSKSLETIWIEQEPKIKDKFSANLRQVIIKDCGARKAELNKQQSVLEAG